MDRIDQRIVGYLSQYGRMTWAELSQMIHLSSPSTIERVKRLEEEGVIKGYYAKVNLVKLNFGLCAFVDVAIDSLKHTKEFVAKAERLVEVFECYKVSGSFEFLLKVHCKDTEHLTHFLEKSLKVIPGVERAQVKVVLETCKESGCPTFEASKEI